MKKIKFLLWVIMLVTIIIQFIRPARNTSGQPVAQSFIDTFQVNDTVRQILASACFDCHSNNTRYPWYTNIQPAGWLMASHVRNGKAKLNFDEIASYGPRKRRSKFKEIKEQVAQGKMPLASYTLLHNDAKLTTEQKGMLIHWIENLSNN